jgi:hypothetical protein
MPNNDWAADCAPFFAPWSEITLAFAVEQQILRLEGGFTMEKAKAEFYQAVPVLREGIIPNPKKKLLDQVREVIRLKHYSIRTEQTYVDWIKRYIFFHGKRHPREMGAKEIEPKSGS